jgi:hypothetical protein
MPEMTDTYRMSVFLGGGGSVVTEMRYWECPICLRYRRSLGGGVKFVTEMLRCPSHDQTLAEMSSHDQTRIEMKPWETSRASQ